MQHSAHFVHHFWMKIGLIIWDIISSGCFHDFNHWRIGHSTYPSNSPYQWMRVWAPWLLLRWLFLFAIKVFQHLNNSHLTNRARRKLYSIDCRHIFSEFYSNPFQGPIFSHMKLMSTLHWCIFFYIGQFTHRFNNVIQNMAITIKTSENFVIRNHLRLIGQIIWGRLAKQNEVTRIYYLPIYRSYPTLK